MRRGDVVGGRVENGDLEGRVAVVYLMYAMCGVVMMMVMMMTVHFRMLVGRYVLSIDPKLSHESRAQTGKGVGAMSPVLESPHVDALLADVSVPSGSVWLHRRCGLERIPAAGGSLDGHRYASLGLLWCGIWV